MKTVAICVALEAEIPPNIKKKWPNHWVRIRQLQAGQTINWKKTPCIMIVIGVGQQARTSITWILQKIAPDDVINIGTAGSNTLPCNHLVMIRDIYFKGNITQASRHCIAPLNYHHLNRVNGETVSMVGSATTQPVIDMESYHIVHACNASLVNCTVFKYITDQNNHQTTKEFNRNLPKYHTSIEAFLSPLLIPTPTNVSVIIPVLNRHNTIQTAIDSVTRQTMPASEIIVIDDGSSPQITHKNTPARIIRHTTNQGVSAARNTGIHASKSDWIACLDSDDVWHPTHLEKLLQYLTDNPLYRWAQSNEQWIRNGHHLNKKRYHKKPIDWGFLASLDRCIVTPSAVIIHRSMFDEFGVFNTNLPACEDYDLWLRFFLYRPIGYCQETTVTKYGGHNDQLSTTIHALDHYRVYSLIQLLQKNLPRDYRAKTIDVALKKLAILIHGAKKRNHIHSLSNYQRLIEKIQTDSLTGFNPISLIKHHP